VCVCRKVLIINAVAWLITGLYPQTENIIVGVDTMAQEKSSLFGNVWAITVMASH